MQRSAAQDNLSVDGRSSPVASRSDTAVGLHRFLDAIRQSSDTGRELEVRS
jgi:hypothetical protein